MSNLDIFPQETEQGRYRIAWPFFPGHQVVHQMWAMMWAKGHLGMSNMRAVWRVLGRSGGPGKYAYNPSEL